MDIISLVNSYRIDYNLIGEETFNKWYLLFMIYGTLVIAVVLALLFAGGAKKAAENFKKKFPEDEILFVSKRGMFVAILGAFIIQLVLVNCVPFLFIKNLVITSSRMCITQNGCWIIFLLALFTILIVCIGLNEVCIFSNKRICIIPVNNIIAKCALKLKIKYKNIKYEDIKFVKYWENFFYDHLNINEELLIAYKTCDNKKIKEILNNHVERDKIDERFQG